MISQPISNFSGNIGLQTLMQVAAIFLDSSKDLKLKLKKWMREAKFHIHSVHLTDFKESFLQAHYI